MIAPYICSKSNLLLDLPIQQERERDILLFAFNRISVTKNLLISHGAPPEHGEWGYHDSIDIALRWSADAGRNRVLLTFHRIFYRAAFTIAFTIHSVDSIKSLDPLE